MIGFEDFLLPFEEHLDVFVKLPAAIFRITTSRGMNLYFLLIGVRVLDVVQ